MTKTAIAIVAVICGVLLGAIGTWSVYRNGAQFAGSTERTVVRDIVAAPKVSEPEAEKLRDEGFKSLTSIEAIFELPSEFNRTEALYALAGRSGAAKLQDLIFAAERIADAPERANALGVLFFRLTEVDPESALALSRTSYFRGDKSIERTVWNTWGRKNLADALIAAKIQAPAAARDFAAQSLFDAFGNMGNEITERIETELGIAPDRNNRARYLYRLADHSPAEAIAYINTALQGEDQRMAASWLANYLAQTGARSAMQFAELFDHPASAAAYKASLQAESARLDPLAVIETALAKGGNFSRTPEFHFAIQALAASDLDAAKQMFANSTSSEARQMFAQAIVERLAESDPGAALAWMRANNADLDDQAMLELQALMHVAQQDPRLALTEALAIDNQQRRQQAVSVVISQVAQINPESAIEYLTMIDSGPLRDAAMQEIAQNWFQTDSNAAINWVLSHDDKTVDQILGSSAWMLVQTDLDAALRLLPKLGPGNQAVWRQQIAEQLVQTRSGAAAMNFVAQFQGEPDYPALQAAVIGNIANRDFSLARQMAEQIADSNTRDMAYLQLVGRQGGQSPQEALAVLPQIRNDAQRTQAASMLAMQWYASEPEAAYQWARSLPAGAEYDGAVLALSQQWTEPTADQLRLIDSITDPDVKGQAKVARVYHLYQTDPALARKVLDDADIPEHLRKEAEILLNRSFGRY
ncbi:MAG TPA: hypothetical protein PKK10_15770 [Woeseiaceae bacterium]|nr:hypothetical protein [Woeseiaceae bacterium]